MARQTIAIALPSEELVPVERELSAAGYLVLPMPTPDDLAAALADGREISLAVIDGDSDVDRAVEFHGRLHEGGRHIPALMVITPRSMELLTEATGSTSDDDEYFTRPYSADSIRWRIEAMLIRAETQAEHDGAVIESEQGLESPSWQKRATIVAVFNPKGGVGKTTVALNLAAALRVHRNQRVLLVDADIVTGHIATSLGMDLNITVADAWLDDLESGIAPRTLAELSSPHPNGLDVCVLTSSPLNTDVLDAPRVGEALANSRRGYDFIIVDMHPSYGPVNQAIFERADRILVPITPDVPAIKAAVQIVDVAERLCIRQKLAMVVNRANSGLSVEDMERTVGMVALAQIRSGGLLFVRAANEGRTVVEMFPKERVAMDFDALADRLLGVEGREGAKAEARSPFWLFGRSKETARV